MSDLREAASCLLEAVVAAIEYGDWKVDGACDPTVDIIRLKNILARPEQGNNSSNYPITESNTPFVDAVNMSQERVDETAKREHEPAAWRYKDENGLWQLAPAPPIGAEALYTAPPKREWVGLTDEEIYDYADKFLYQHGSNYGIKSFGKAIEAKLKEKNT